ncbi:MAG: ATP-binding cassette domain-containing protein, partial [Verrucomicrobiota bacterium]
RHVMPVGLLSHCAFATNCTQLLQQLVSIGIVILGVYQIKEGNLTMGGMIACVILGGRGMAPLGQVASLFTRLQQSRTALQGLNQIMELPTERSEGRQRVQLEEFKPDIELKDVQLTYPNQPAPALAGLNLEIKAGERVALLGRVGSGKSTLLKLLAGLYEPEQGVVNLSGVELRQFDPSDLRQRVGYVSQQVTLFYGSVLDNLRLGALWVSDDEVLSAVKAAGVDRFTEGHPDGVQRSVGERGELLSGGQRQAVALARSLVTSPSLLLFDEPTSSMDMNSEGEFVSALTQYLDEHSGTTLLLSTHKPAVLKLVDRIIVLQDGKVAADGPRDQVMGKLSQSAKSPAAAATKKKAPAKKKSPKTNPDK